jgi:hypothetical protein
MANDALLLCLKGSVLSAHENTSVIHETSLSASLRITLYLCRYNGNASVRCLGKDVFKFESTNPIFRHSETVVQDVVTEPLSSNGLLL